MGQICASWPFSPGKAKGVPGCLVIPTLALESPIPRWLEA